MMATPRGGDGYVTRMLHGVRDRLIINFHGIGPPSDDVPEAERPYWCPRELWPAMADAIADVAAQAKVKIEITFDDGNLSDVEEALPALTERQLTASFYVCAGRIGVPRYLTADHLHMLRDAGMAIGSHGWSHRDLRQTSDADLPREADESRLRIAEVTGSDVTGFAIPFGSYDRRVLRHLKAYAAVYTSDRMRASSNSWLKPRHSYAQGWSPQEIRRLASERMALLDYARRRAAMVYKRFR
jgi:peptidoglycan/xylan/chitin deacetylase (PgdA/CDA1 family)